MLRNYLAAALGHLLRNKVTAAINIFGLALGFAAVLLIALFVRDELNYDKWIPDHQRVYLAGYNLMRPGHAPTFSDGTPPAWAHWLKLDFPQIEAIARLHGADASIRRDDREFTEHLYWADPDFFSVVKLPAIAGEPSAALKDPAGIVVTRRIARKYFGRDTPVGEILEIDRNHPMRVMAVLEDLPSNSTLDIDIIASGRASFSGLARIDTTVPSPIAVYTYFKLGRGGDISELRNAMPTFFERHNSGALNNTFGITFDFPLTALADLHVAVGNDRLMRPRGNLATIYAVSAVGALILLLAAINFVNLMTARAARRASEIGIRKVSGALRWDLVVQFIGESLGYTFVGLLLAAGLAFAVLPSFNAFLQRTMVLDFLGDPVLAATALAVMMGVGGLAGFYPALVLSSFQPAKVLKGGVSGRHDSGTVRLALVLVQFAVLIGLVLATAVIALQTRYAFTQAMRLDTDQVLLIPTTCKAAFKAEVALLSGVRAAACSSRHALNFESFSTVVTGPNGSFQFARAPVDIGFLELYGFRPLAGRFFGRDRGDQAPADQAAPFRASLVINETAARQLGFASPQAAIGAQVGFKGRRDYAPSEIIGIVSDFALDGVHTNIPATVYFAEPGAAQILSVKLAGRDIPETLAAIDDLWERLGEPRPIQRFFLAEAVQENYLSISRQAQIFAAFAAVALLIACFGLFGLSAFAVERRTKEVGIRKSMGATRTDILRLLLWQFAKPVLLANLVAWPVAYVIMRRWLESFAYHIDLAPWMFLAASGLALLIALLTVIGHALLVARAAPVAALRYE